MDVVFFGGNVYGEEMIVICLWDFDYYLCLIFYGIVFGDVIFIEEIGFVGVCEMYKFLGIFIEVVVEGVCCMKIVICLFLDYEGGSEVVIYFDYVIGVMS